MSKDIFQKGITEDSEASRIKVLADYTGEELDHIHETDPDLWEKLWADAEMQAINNPDNHDKSH